MHKEFKEDANHTLKNSATFDSQIAKNHSESHAIHRANRELNPSSTLDAAGDDKPVVAKGLHFYVDKDGMFEVDSKKPTSKSQQMASWVDINLMARVTKYVHDSILPFVPGDRVMLLTQAKVDGTLYRANPCYQSSHKEIGRHDWVNVQWSESHGNVPGRIIVFVDLPKIFPPKAGAAIQSVGLYAIICSVEQSLYSEPDQTLATRKGHLNYLAHQSTKIVYWSELVHKHHVPIGGTELIKEPTLYLVNVEETFVSPVIAVPYDLSDPDQIGWLFIEPVDKFLEILRTVMREMIRKS